MKHILQTLPIDVEFFSSQSSTPILILLHSLIRTEQFPGEKHLQRVEMYYWEVDEKRAAQKPKFEGLSEIERILRERMHGEWPANVLESVGEEHIHSKVLHLAFMEHDRAHNNCRVERWHVNGRVGRNRRYGISATFCTTALMSALQGLEAHPHLAHLSAVQFAIVDTSTSCYYRFSKLDSTTPLLLEALLANGDRRAVDKYLLQASIEQINADRLVLPDQLFPGAAVVRSDVLDLNFHGCSLRAIASKNPDGQFEKGVVAYQLHLEGCTMEHSAGGDPNEEIKAVIDLIFQPCMNPVLHGDHGIVSPGDCWADEQFCYSFPHLRMREGSLRLTRLSDEKEVARELDIKEGMLWMEHRFGGALSRTADEAAFLRSVYTHSSHRPEELLVDQCTLRLFNTDQDCVCVTREVDSAGVGAARTHAVVQCGAKREGHAWRDGVGLVAVSSKQYRSKQTGLLYSTQWQMHTPTHAGARMELTLTAAFAEQEFVTSLAQPSFWEGVVCVEGTVIFKDGTTAPVSGEGFMSCHGRGYEQKLEELFRVLRSVSTMAMEKPEVSTVHGCEAIADGPAMRALSSLSIVASMQELNFTLAEKVVLAALLGAYGYVFHHPTDRKQVQQALEWCQSKWLTFCGQGCISYQTLRVRAFMLRELDTVMQSKCGAWIPKGAAALDLMGAPAVLVFSSGSKKAEMGSHEIPSLEQLAHHPTAVDLSQLKALMDGKWQFKVAHGSLSAVLIEQDISLLMRGLLEKTRPTLHIEVNRDAAEINFTISTELDKVNRCYRLNGTAWEWVCPLRRTLTIRACVLAGGRQLYVEMRLPQRGVERTWYSFTDKGRKLVESISYYSTQDHLNAPVSSCVRYYTLDLP